MARSTIGDRRHSGTRNHMAPSRPHQMEIKENTMTHRMANLRGAQARTKKSRMQMVKQTAAPRLHAPKISRRSHRLTASVGQHATPSQISKQSSSC